jgi:spermidine synthase
VIPWTLIDSGAIPGSSDTLRLMRRGEEFSIRLGQTELMNTRLSGSEEALAALACGRLDDRAEPDILIGGLGMGFTLRAALAALPTGARITVAELVPSVVTWARGPLAHVFGSSLTDPRVAIRETDVAEIIHASRAGFDAILLDVDNGPDGLTSSANDRLYDKTGLHAARAALRPGGVLAVWSAEPSIAFSKRLATAGFDVEEVSVRAHRGRSGARHRIWLATRPPPRRRDAEP